MISINGGIFGGTKGRKSINRNGVGEKKKKIPMLIKVISYLLVIFSSILTYNQNIFSYTMSYQLISFIVLIFLLPFLRYKNNQNFFFSITSVTGSTKSNSPNKIPFVIVPSQLKVILLYIHYHL